MLHNFLMNVHICAKVAAFVTFTRWFWQIYVNVLNSLIYKLRIFKPQASGFDVNAQVLQGRALIHIAADYGQADVITFLISKGAEVNVSIFCQNFFRPKFTQWVPEVVSYYLLENRLFFWNCYVIKIFEVNMIWSTVQADNPYLICLIDIKFTRWLQFLVSFSN